MESENESLIITKISFPNKSNQFNESHQSLIQKSVVKNRIENENCVGSSLCSGLLKEIWKYHIFIYINNEETEENNNEEIKKY